MERTGIYGGSFNPPHIGHIQAARQAYETLKLDRLLVIPDAIAPHKEFPANTPSPEERLEMLRIAAKGHPELEISDLEIRRTGVSFTCDTVDFLRENHPDTEFVLLMGSDMFLSFETWKNYRHLLETVELGVFCRGDRGEAEAIRVQKQKLEQQGAGVTLIDNEVCAISSTQMRRLMAFHAGEEFLPDGVGDYIRSHGLYDAAAHWKNLPMEELEPIVVSLMKPSRVKHILGVRDTAVKLAEIFGADVTDAARAGILHDITKALDGPLQLTLCRAHGKMLDDFSLKHPKTLHAHTGALVAKEIFGENQAVVDAIDCHTTGKPNMNLLEEILYVADYMEPSRNFPGVERLRALAFRDVHAALILGMQMTLDHLKEQGIEASPETRQTLDWLNVK